MPESYFLDLVDTFKYTFECCGVLPPLAIQLPQIGASISLSNINDDYFFDEEINQEMTEDVDIQ